MDSEEQKVQILSKIVQELGYSPTALLKEHGLDEQSLMNQISDVSADADADEAEGSHRAWRWHESTELGGVDAEILGRARQHPLHSSTCTNSIQRLDVDGRRRLRQRRRARGLLRR